MGRRQVPLDGQGQVVRFAAGLRQARESAGLTLRKLAEVSGYSASTLSTAENGKKLPSWDVVEAFLRACGETDIPRWRGRWDAAAEDDHAEPAVPVTTLHRMVRLRTAWVLVVLTAITSSALTAAVFLDVENVSVKPAGGVGQADPIADGSDPGRAGCNDGVTQAATRVHFPTDQLSGEVELRYSPHCHAAWARFAPAAGWHPGPGTMITVWTIRPADQATQTYTVEFGGESVIGNLLLTARGCVSAEVTVARAGVTSPVAETACMVIN